jgi:hypothetical protein
LILDRHADRFARRRQRGGFSAIFTGEWSFRDQYSGGTASRRT